jgi:hypothetical protein
MERVRVSAASVERIVAGGETVYGINTGFGLLANTRIPPERLAELQRHGRASKRFAASCPEASSQPLEVQDCIRKKHGKAGDD